MARPLRIALGVLGALIYAGAGAVMGSQNAGWFGPERESNDLLPVLGVGAGLVVVAFMPSSFNAHLGSSGGLGKASQVLIVVGCVLFVFGSLIGFAIFGTLGFGFGLVLLAVTVTKEKLVSLADRILIILSAIGSLTWNTETVSAFLLVGVGLIWVILSIRLLPDSNEVP